MTEITSMNLTSRVHIEVVPVGRADEHHGLQPYLYIDDVQISSRVVLPHVRQCFSVDPV